MNTTLLLIDYGHPGNHNLLIPETPLGYSIDDAVSDVLSGAHHGRLRAVYAVKEGEPSKIVSEEVADKIAAAWIAGQFLSPMAREFVDWMGGEIKERAA